MAFVNVKPGTLLSPVPVVLVSCARQGERPNAITIAWTGTVNSEPPMCSVSVRKERYSHDIIAETGEFVINLCDEKLLKGLDYCGVKSGREEDKLSAAHLHTEKAEGLSCAPAISEAPLYLACRVVKTEELGSHDMFIGEIVGVGVREDRMDEKGKICLEDLVHYAHGVYYGEGAPLGFFGHSVAAPDVLKRRMAELKKK